MALHFWVLTTEVPFTVKYHNYNKQHEHIFLHFGTLVCFINRENVSYYTTIVQNPHIHHIFFYVLNKTDSNLLYIWIQISDF